MDHGKLHHLEAKLAHLEAERTLLLARLAALEGRARPAEVVESPFAHWANTSCSVPRAHLERLQALLSAVWLDLQEIRPRRVQELEEALEILEGVLA